jgi:hypothetical protein
LHGSLPRKSLISRMDWVSCAGGLRSLGHFPFSTLRREILTSLPLIWCTHLQGFISS